MGSKSAGHYAIWKDDLFILCQNLNKFECGGECEYRLHTFIYIFIKGIQLREKRLKIFSFFAPKGQLFQQGMACKPTPHLSASHDIADHPG